MKNHQKTKMLNAKELTQNELLNISAGAKSAPQPKEGPGAGFLNFFINLFG